ncbi:hypothetical protein MTR67_040201 [Solanum verrucosum]|uniref:Chromo domain-containing protein n=1 Tax=Solanum verrucosum TaxID=315347 RepID=A0AAF0ZPK1_SOLVR|nr:hypothetical protein MTR67_040201 [Solanum verrucosum]
MAPFEALYGRGCRSLIVWFEASDVKPLGVDLVKDAQDKVKSIQAKLLAAQSKQKKYVDHKVRDMTFQIGETVVLKVSPMKRVMRFGKKDKDLKYKEEPIAILDRDVRKLRTKEIKSVKVQWKHRPVEEATWEIERDMRDNILKVYNFGRSILASRNHSAIRRLLLFVADLVLSFRAWHTGTLGGQMSHSATHRVLLAILRLALLHFFSLFCSFLPVSVLALFLNPYT